MEKIIITGHSEDNKPSTEHNGFLTLETLVNVYKKIQFHVLFCVYKIDTTRYYIVFINLKL